LQKKRDIVHRNKHDDDNIIPADPEAYNFPQEHNEHGFDVKIPGHEVIGAEVRAQPPIHNLIAVISTP